MPLAPLRVNRRLNKRGVIQPVGSCYLKLHPVIVEISLLKLILQAISELDMTRFLVWCGVVLSGQPSLTSVTYLKKPRTVTGLNTYLLLHRCLTF